MKKNRLNNKKDTVPFSLETSKGYMISIIILFHIVPLICVFLGEYGDAILASLLMLINPFAIFIINLVFGLKQGFSWKLPLFTIAIFAPSIIMYYNSITTPEEITQAIMTTVIFIIVYFIFSLIAMWIGKWLKKYL